MRGNLRSQNKSVRMVNFRIYTDQEGSKSKRRFVEIKKREHIFAYINSKDHYIAALLNSYNNTRCLFLEEEDKTWSDVANQMNLDLKLTL